MCYFIFTIVLVVLFAYRTTTTWQGLIIVISGVPVYLLLRHRKANTGDPA